MNLNTSGGLNSDRGKNCAEWLVRKVGARCKCRMRSLQIVVATMRVLVVGAVHEAANLKQSERVEIRQDKYMSSVN